MRGSAVALLLGAPLVWAQEAVEFRFAPPDGTAFTATTTNHRSVNTGATTMEDDVETTVKGSIRKTASGYTITRTVNTRNGNQLDAAMNGATITWTLDSTGHITSASGYEKPLETFRSQLPAENRAQAAASLTPEAMQTRDQTEWDRHVGRFNAKQIKAGEALTDTTKVPGPNGAPMELKTVTTLAGLSTCGTAKCARLEVTERTAAGAPVDIDSKSEILIDPATGLLYSESTDRTAKLEQNGQKMEISEKRATKYEYSAANPIH